MNKQTAKKHIGQTKHMVCTQWRVEAPLNKLFKFCAFCVNFIVWMMQQECDFISLFRKYQTGYKTIINTF